MTLVPAAAVFVLLAALAGTWIVTPYLWTGTNRFGLLDSRGSFTDNITALLRSVASRLGGSRIRGGAAAAKRASRLMRGALGNIAQEVLEGHQTGGASE